MGIRYIVKDINTHRIYVLKKGSNGCVRSTVSR